MAQVRTAGIDEVRLAHGPGASHSGRRTTLPAAAEFHRSVRDALAHLNDPAYLQTHPLPAVSAVTGMAAPLASASALRQAVVDAIRSLQPKTRSPADSTSWRR